jgi:uncharacterized protein
VRGSDVVTIDADDRTAFLDAVLRNPVIPEILGRVRELGLPDWWLAAGCLFQTVWNVLDGHDPARGILDYDLIYFDGTDLSWEAEDAVIRRADAVFGDLGVAVEVRNQARVHLWFGDHFGFPYRPLSSSAEAIDRYLAVANQFGLRDTGAGPEVYAPAGFDDLFAFVVRPNPGAGPGHAYERKAARWKAQWPRLTIVPWPTEA